MTDAIDFEAPSQDDVQFDLRSLFLGAIKASLETLLEADSIRPSFESVSQVGHDGFSHSPERCR